MLAEPGARLHLYGKREARPGRKMGHVTRAEPDQAMMSGMRSLSRWAMRSLSASFCFFSRCSSTSSRVPSVASWQDALIERAMRGPQRLEPGVDLRLDRPFVHHVMHHCRVRAMARYSTGSCAESTASAAACVMTAAGMGWKALSGGMTRLIADIGGTNARFALVEAGRPAVDERHLLVRDFPDLGERDRDLSRRPCDRPRR